MMLRGRAASLRRDDASAGGLRHAGKPAFPISTGLAGPVNNFQDGWHGRLERAADGRVNSRRMHAIKHVYASSDIETNSMKILSLFSGAGGLSLGMASEGLKPALAVELNKDAVATYKKNLQSDCLQADIAHDHPVIIEEARKRIGNERLLAVIGGPPCQGFSTAGVRQADDLRNRLVFSYLHLVEELSPDWFLFENVEGLLTSGYGEAIESLARRFIEIGYSLRIEKVNFAGFGIPQSRKRVLIVGNRLGINFELPQGTFSFDGKKHRGSGSKNAPSVAEALLGLGSPASSLKGISSYTSSAPKTAYDALMRGSGLDGISLHVCRNYDRDRDRINRLRPGQSMKDLPEELWPPSYRSRAFRRVIDGMPVERRGGAPAGLRRLTPDHVSLTITSFSSTELIHPEQDRPLSLRECARLQSFPDAVDFHGNFASVALQIANAFPPLAAKIYARWLLETDGRAGGGLASSGPARPGLIGFKLTESNGKSPALAATELRLTRLLVDQPAKRLKPPKQSKRLLLDARNEEGGMLDVETKKLITRARTAKPITMPDRELARLVSVVLRDLGHSDLVPTFVDLPKAEITYFDIPLDWFTKDAQRPFAFPEFFLKCKARVENFATIFACLCELHKRRRKYNWILSAQPMPTMDQVARRGLLEYGVVGQPALTSWLMWRKWIYDIDNRSAQETGYLFEPILAASLGGESFGSRNSPVTRLGKGKEGRQVDCIVDAGTEKLAYEFKARFTIASSGQGRFREELEFPIDCRLSKYKPVLLVLDETDNDKLRQLVKAFQDNGGEAYLGDAVWRHVEARSGQEIANFVARYVREPILRIDRDSEKLRDMNIAYRPDQKQVVISVGDQSWKIERLDDETIDMADDE